MTPLPFATASQSWRTWSTALDTVGQELSAASLLSGQTGTKIGAIASAVDDVSGKALKLALASSELSDVCATQSLYDAALDAAPSPSEVEHVKSVADEARQRMKRDELDPDTVEQLDKVYADFKEKRDDAVEKHREDTSGTVIPDPPVVSDLKDPYTGGDGSGSGSGPGASGPSGSGDGSGEFGGDDADDEELSPGDTELSSGEGGQSASAPMLSQPQTQQPQQAGAGTGSPSTGMPMMSNPVRDTSRPEPKMEKDRRDVSFPDRVSDTQVKTTTSAFDPGSSVTGTTRSDTTGINPNTAPATGANPNAQGQGAGSRMGGMGGMGGMPMGGMGGGAGGGGKSTRDKPEIYSTDPDLDGTSSVEHAWDGGVGQFDPNEFLREEELRRADSAEVIDARENPHVPR